METRYAVLHTPGREWVAGVEFSEQDGIMEHVNHYRKLLEEDKLYLGGPYLERDSGGMMVAELNVDRQELEDFAASDPAVKSGLLNYKIVSWYIAMKKA